MSVVDLHPQRSVIIEGILAGESLRQLASRINPTIHHATLGRFRLRLLQSATKPLTQNHAITHNFKDLITVATGDDSDMRASERLSMGLRGELSGLVRAKLTRRDRWIKDAEARPILDDDARPITREADDGELIPLTQMDHKALAAHDRNETSDLDLLARLGQLYSDAGESGPGLTAVMSFGDIIVNVAGAVATAPQVIDAVAEPMDVGVVRAGNRR